MVALISGIQVGICVWIQHEIGPIESFYMGRVVVINTMPIHEFPYVVGVVSSALEPDGEEIIIEASFNELGISTYTRLG